ncbi:hypothetical protein [Methylobacter sp.]|uniref:hypothetical protein n=1 Tax=Methylobacter sp. TaxID=2051955 RepID=UPI00120683EA|nr:hypothetical protein [Methylobacter sp.]TAK59511.1 MAG: hypothetical protein EPO18_20330 [Methylobacter sp.]
MSKVRVLEETRILVDGGKFELLLKESTDGCWDLDVVEHTGKKVRLGMQTGAKIKEYVFFENVVERYISG